MLKYIFSSFLLFFFLLDGFSQENKLSVKKTTKTDTIIYKTAYGIRIGADISKPIRTQLDKNYKGFELVGDYRLTKKLYIATELGVEEFTSEEDYTNSTASGTYIRVGTNYNVYSNWLDMNNEVYLGLRYGFSSFKQTLNSYTTNINNTYFSPNNITTPIITKGLTAHWIEFGLGMKVETLKNLFLSANVSYNIMLSVKNPPNFKSLYSPGFNRIFLSNTGFGFNYTISYLIPFIKK